MSLDRLSKLLNRAADPANQHEAEQAAKLAEALALKLPKARYGLRAGKPFQISPERGGTTKTLTSKHDIVCHESDRIHSEATILKGYLPFRTRMRGTSDHFVLFLPIKDIEVF